MRGEDCLGAGNTFFDRYIRMRARMRAVSKRSAPKRAQVVQLANWLLQSLLVTTHMVVNHFWKEMAESGAICLRPIMAVSDF